MKSNFLLIALLILFGSHSLAQEKIEREYNSIITFSTFSPIVNYAPRWNLGYIRKIEKRYWLGVEIGYGNQNLSVNFAEEGGWIKKDYKIFEIKPEIYYDLRPKSNLKHLLSLELQYLNHLDNFKNSWYYNLENKTYYRYDLADYQRVKYGVNINYSLIYNITKKLAIMQKTGIGFRQRNVKYSNIINKIEDENFEESDVILVPVSNGFLRDNGINNSFNFNLDLKIIYKF